MLTKTRERLRKACDELKLLRMKGKRGPASRYFSVRGGYTTAVKQVVCNVAPFAMGVMTETDTSRTSIGQWVLRLRAAQLLEFRTWQQGKIQRAQLQGSLQQRLAARTPSCQDRCHVNPLEAQKNQRTRSTVFLPVRPHFGCGFTRQLGGHAPTTS